MIDKIQLELLSVLNKGEAYVSYADTNRLKALSDEAIHSAGIYQDQDSLKVAIIVYALSKIFERGQIDPAPFTQLLREAHERLENGNVDEFHHTITKLLDRIGHEDTKMGLYVEEVLHQAKVRKAGKLIAQGLSINQSAHLLGVSSWELMHYIGKTNLGEDMPSLDVKSRMNFTRSLFR